MAEPFFLTDQLSNPVACTERGTMLTHQLRCRPVGVALLSCALTLGMVACDPEANTSPLDPKLGALASNGGPTKTHALRPGSPALDAVSTAD